MVSKRQIHSTQRLKNIKKQKPKFPDILLKVVDTSDIILQVLDSRFIEETRNKEIEELIKNSGKILIHIFNKSDLSLANKRIKNLSPYVFISCTKRKGIKKLRERIKIEARKVKHSKENTFNRIQVGVIGYPNVGKSSVINLLKGKTSAGVGSESGFTKGLQKIKLTSKILLLDSPGVIPTSKYSHEDEEKISLHAKLGARSHNKIKYPELVISSLMEEYAMVLEKHYKIQSKNDSEVFLEKLGRKLNYLKKGNEVDTDRTSRKILRDWQTGVIKI